MKSAPVIYWKSHHLNYWFSRFVVEARCADGDQHPSSTLYQRLAGLLRYESSKTRDCSNILDKSNPKFKSYMVHAILCGLET